MSADGTTRRPTRQNLDHPDPRSSSPADGEVDATDAILRHLDQLDMQHLDVGQLVRDIEKAETAVRAGAQGASAPGNEPTAPLVSPGPALRPVVEADARPKTVPTSKPVFRADTSAIRPLIADAGTDGSDSTLAAPPARSNGPFASPLVLAGVVVAVVVLAYILWRPRETAQFAGVAARTTAATPAAEPRVESTDPVAAPAPSPSAAPSTPPASAAVPSLPELVQTARQRYRSGARPEALDAIAQGMSLKPDDRDIRALLRQALSDARAEFGAAQRTARAADGAGTPGFVDAEQRAQEGARLAAASPSIDAVRTYWAATDAMTTATAEAKRHPGVKAPSVESAPIPAATATPSVTAASTPAPPPQTPAQTSAPVSTGTPRPASPTPSPVTTAPEGATPLRPTSSPVPTPTVERAVAPQPASLAPQSPGTSDARTVDTLASDEQAIRAVLSAYADAHSRLDAAGVRALFPATDIAALQRTFSRIRSQRVQILNEQIQVTGATAIVSCVWQTVFELDAGAPNRSAPRTTLTLQRAGDTWVIVGRR